MTNPTNSEPSRFEPRPTFADPRTQAGFQPSHWPLYNGAESPPIGVTDLHERRCLEFLAAYYEVNCRWAEVHAARTAGVPKSELHARLAAVEAALQAVDALEDRYAAIGFCGEPAMQGDFYHDIEFHRAELPQILPDTEMVSSHLAIPGLEEIPAEELCGPFVVSRLTYGKVDP
jgi:hypothetical protein